MLVGKEKMKIETLADALEKIFKIPKRPVDAKPRIPVSGVYKIKGIGDVITECVEDGTIKPEDQVLFLPTHTASTPCQGKVSSE